MNPSAITSLPDFHEPHSVTEGKVSVTAEHDHLHALMDDLITTIHKGRGPITVGEYFEALVQQTAEHFRHEEKVMQAYDYPDQGSHKTEHRGIMNRLMRHRRLYATGVELLTEPAVLRLKKMLDAHVANEDEMLMRFLTSLEN